MSPRRALRFLVAAPLAGAATMLAVPALAYCPSYTTTAGCAVNPVAGTNPTPETFRLYFDKLGTGSFTADEGPLLPAMTRGCDKPTPEAKGPSRFPCHVLYALAQQESDWTQFCVPETPSSAIGSPSRTIVSFDCGFGIAQVTSGMREGETPSFDQQRVAADALYNMIVGARILRDKWEYVECVGDRDPELVEHWYSALWAYNGLSYKNNPNNPTYAAGRGAYDPDNGGAYPYQERVFGWMESPKAGRWEPILPAYPNRGEIGSGSSPRALSEPSCVSPTSCAGKRVTNKSACKPPPVADAGAPLEAGAPEPERPVVDAGAGPAADDGDADAEAGCACRTTSAASRGGGVWVALAALALAKARRRGAKR